MTTPTYRCSNGFRTIKGKRAVAPAAHATSTHAICTSACCLTIVGGRLHRCGFLAEYKKER
jgi:hypothetical protein